MDPSLLSALLGAAPAAGVNGHTWGVDGDGYLVPQTLNPNQAPAPSPTAAASPLQPQSVPQQSPPSIDTSGLSPMVQQAITVTGKGDTWHPHKRTLLGTIADFALAAMGLPFFPFGRANEGKNVHEALQGFQANPRQAIQRLMQVGGHESDAVKLAGQEDDSDMKAANYKRMNDALDFQKQKQAEGIAANMMYSASQAKDPASAWTAMREQVVRRDQVMGTNVADEIPESPDLSAIDILAGSNIPAWRQAALFESARNHDLQHGDREANTSEMTRHHEVTEGQGAARVGISEQNANTAEYNAQTSRRSEEKRPNQVPGGRGMVTMKNGMKLPYEDQPDGSRVVYAPDGTAYRYVNINGTFVPTHQKIPPKQAPQQQD